LSSTPSGVVDGLGIERDAVERHRQFAQSDRLGHPGSLNRSLFRSPLHESDHFLGQRASRAFGAIAVQDLELAGASGKSTQW